MKKLLFISLLAATACTGRKLTANSYGGSVKTAAYVTDSLPAPLATPSSMNFSKVEGWPAGKMPIAPAGFSVTRFAEGLEHPRWIYVAENGDIFVAESNTVLKGIKKIGAKISRKIKTQHVGVSANKIMMYRDANKDGIPEKSYVFLENLNQPFGMLIIGHQFFVGNTNALMAYDYTPGDTVIHQAGKKLIDLPVGKRNQHWARNIITNRQHDKIFIGIGSATNIADLGLDNETGRAEILEVNIDGSHPKIYASGLRNPCGMDWAPGTDVLWTAVNERDELGDELVPDYLTGVKQGGFYGWPYSYFGQHPDPRLKDHPHPELVARAIVPDLTLGSHTASLGLLFYQKTQFPKKYTGGAFITQHGSWNRSVLSGYKVIFVPFANGRPSGDPEDFLTGFTDDLTRSTVYGRPVGIAILSNGTMLISDDVNNLIWRVSYTGKNGEGTR